MVDAQIEALDIEAAAIVGVAGFDAVYLMRNGTRIEIHATRNLGVLSPFERLGNRRWFGGLRIGRAGLRERLIGFGRSGLRLSCCLRLGRSLLVEARLQSIYLCLQLGDLLHSRVQLLLR